MNDKKLIQVGYFASGFLKECDSFVGWLRHCNITVTCRLVGNHIVVEADEFNAKAIWGLQIADPARYGNCPAIKKYLAINKGDETKKDRDFIKAFYAKDASWETKVALAEAYMKEEVAVVKIKEEKPPKTKIGKCCDCEKVKEVIFDVCPYDADVNNGTEKVWKCQECRDSAAQDI
jgi:hypothetical protein